MAHSHARVLDAVPLTQSGVFNLSWIVALAVLTLVLGGNTRAQANIVISTPPGHDYRQPKLEEGTDAFRQVR